MIIITFILLPDKYIRPFIFIIAVANRRFEDWAIYHVAFRGFGTYLITIFTFGRTKKQHNVFLLLAQAAEAVEINQKYERHRSKILFGNI